MGMKHEIYHGLDQALTKKALDKAMEAYAARFSDYHPTFEWETETRGRLGFKAKGLTVAGDIEIVGDVVTVDFTVPFILRIFRGRAIDVVDREVKIWIEKAKNGELDA